MLKRIFQGVGVVIMLGLVVIVVLAVRFDKSKDDLIPIYTNAASQFIVLPDGSIAHVRDQGKKEGPVLVLIHGSNS